MHSKIIVSLALIVLLPLGLLGGLGWRLVGNEQQIIAHRFQTLANAQLAAVDETIQSYFRSLRDELWVSAQSLDTRLENLRRFTRNEPRVRQILIMSADGERRHPPRDVPLTQGEQRLLERTQELWRDQDILYQSAAPEGSSASKIPIESKSEQGWYVWHWGRETHLIFWRRDSSGQLLGLELEPVRVLADIINVLPATGGLADHTGQARIQLLDERGTVVYQWGRFQPEQSALARLPLSHPLGTWRLAYFAPALHDSGQQRLLLLGILLAVAVTLVGLAFYLYREHGREIRLARQRVNFVSQVSHELKTPLTNIRMYAELLEDQIPDDEDRARRYLDVIITESQRLSRLIANVLNFARQQRQQLRLRLQPGRVDAVVASVLAVFRPALEAKGMQVEFQAGADSKVQCDPDVLEQILNNLLGNVEKYAASGGWVQIATQQQAEQTLIQIQDKGPGIPKRERERIFRPFYRISSKLNEGVSGTGIGLTISAELACLHGGNLHLQPTQQGACFQVSLNTPSLGEPT